MRRWVRAGAGLLLICALAVGGLAVYGASLWYRSPGPLASDTTLIIPRGASLAGIARRLEAAGVVTDALVFRLGVRAHGAGQSLQAGEYAFAAGATMPGVMDLLASGKTVVRRLTVPEGLTSAEVVALLGTTEGLVGEVGATPAEGSLLPETYHYSWGDERAALIERMQRSLDAALAELWAARAPDLPFTTPEDAVVLASIVEKETGVPDERPLVASVFMNRLERGMRLQSDPTVVYGLTQGRGPLGRPLTRADLDTPSPYNTYLIDGLPPGPIANPGRASLAAVLDPAETGYLYFVADGDGGHAFAETLEEHNRNVAEWRRSRDEQE